MPVRHWKQEHPELSSVTTEVVFWMIVCPVSRYWRISSRVADGRMKVFVDGAFRTGNDVFKALALGADGVLIGRPVLSGDWRRK